MDNIDVNFNKLIDSVNTEQYLDMSLATWRARLAQEVGCYVCDDQYLCRKFDQINFNFCTLSEAEEIVRDNVYCLLRYKYLTHKTDDVEKRINDIVRNFCANIKTSLLRTTLRENSPEDCYKVKMLQRGEIAFHNGVYSFIENRWIIRYKKVYLEDLRNTLYEYNHTEDKNGRIVTWYYNFDFQPLNINIMDVELSDFFDAIKAMNEKRKNLCFELMYNMAHDMNDIFSWDRFVHLCEIIGFLLDASPIQKFVMLIGSGQNGKNSLIDGCLSKKIWPTPIGNSISQLEEDKFASGTLVNRYHNICLETSTRAASYKDNTNLKELTGSTEHTVEKKGENKFNTYINCKFLFSANDQDRIKFSDNTEGFKRRINMLELYYRWDEKKDFLRKGDYYDTSFSEDLREITTDMRNVVYFIYFGMFGIKEATSGFKKLNFSFSHNDWNIDYSDIDFDLKESIERITVDHILLYMETHYPDSKATLFGTDKKRLYENNELKELGYTQGYNDLVSLLRNPDAYMSFFANNDVYINLKVLKDIAKIEGSSNNFTTNIKKLYGLKKLESLYNNQPYLKVNLASGKIKVLAIQGD